MSLNRLRLIEVCEIEKIPDKFVNIYKFIIFYQSEMSNDKLFSVEDVDKVLNYEYSQVIKELVQYGVENKFIEDGEKPISRLSVKFGR